MDRKSIEQRSMPNPYDQFVAQHPEETERLERLINEGRVLLEKGAVEEARVRFVKALAIFPLIPSALTNLATLALHNENPEQAWHYLVQVLEHFPEDPSAHAIAIRYWLQRGSHPKAYHHGRAALAGLEELIQRTSELRDPSLPDRARVILRSVLPSLEADDLLSQLYALCHDRTWDNSALLTFGIALYNRGDTEAARHVWLRCDSSGPASLYLFLLELIDRGIVVPFRLDYELSARLPSLDELRKALDADPRGNRNPLRLVQPNAETSESDNGGEVSSEEAALIQALRFAVVRDIPGLAVLEGLQHIFRGTAEEAELALSILFFERWPHLPQVLPAVVENTRLPMRVRLNGALYLLWTVGEEAARDGLRHLETLPMGEQDELLASIIWMQIALVTEDVQLGQTSEARAREMATQIETTADIESWLVVLEELSHRLQHDAEQKGIEGRGSQPKQDAERQSKMNKIIPFPTGRRGKGPSELTDGE